MKRKIVDGLHAFAGLCTGATVYCLFGGFWFLGGVHWLDGAPASALLRNYLPDACWAYALSFALGTVFQEDVRAIWCCAAAAMACGCLWESAQALDIASGTPDGLDLLAYLAGAILSVMIKLMKKRTDKT